MKIAGAPEANGPINGMAVLKPLPVSTAMISTTISPMVMIFSCEYRDYVRTDLERTSSQTATRMTMPLTMS